MYFKSYRPGHRVTIYRKANGFTPEDISDDIVSLSTSKTYSHCAGGFQILTTYNRRFEQKRYDQLLKTNDRVLIELDKGDGKGLRPVMLGLVDRPSREEDYTNPKRIIRRVKIAGTDMGKMLLRHNCAWDIQVKDPNSVVHEGSEAYIRTVEFNGKLCGTPGDLVTRIVQNYLYNQIPWTAQFILSDQITTDDDWWSMDDSIATETGPIWPLLKDYENTPWNTLHTDTFADGKFHIILERTPYDITDGRQGKLTRSTFYQLDDVDIVSASLGTSDAEMVNFLLHHVPEGIFQENPGSNLLFLGGRSVRRFNADGTDPTSNQAGGAINYHGFQLHKIPTVFTAGKAAPSPIPPRIGNGGADPNVDAAVKIRTDAYWNWFSCNHLLESGTIAIKGDPDLQTGMAILRTSDNMEYLAEQVNHNYIWGGSYTTTVGVTRGQAHGRV